MPDNQCNKVLKKNNLRLGIEFLVSSKLLLFLPFRCTRSNNGGYLSKDDHFNDDQNDLANRLKFEQQI